MGLLSRLGRAAGAFGKDAGEAWKYNAPLGNAAFGAVPGAFAGAGLNQEDPLSGALTGAAIGAGALGGGQALRALGSGIRGAAGSMAETAGPEALARLKQEALTRWARNAPDNIKQQIMDAQTPDEVTQLVEWVVSRTPVRNRAGGF